MSSFTVSEEGDKTAGGQGEDIGKGLNGVEDMGTGGSGAVGEGIGGEGGDTEGLEEGDASDGIFSISAILFFSHSFILSSRIPIFASRFETLVSLEAIICLALFNSNSRFSILKSCGSS